VNDLAKLLLRVRENTPLLLGVSGYPRSGKDAFAEVLVNEYGFTKVAFADKLKEMALAIDPIVHAEARDGSRVMRLGEVIHLYGWEHAKDHFPEVRRFLKYLATEGVRAQDPDFWARSAFAEVVKHPRVVMPDVRFVNEFDAIRFADGINIRINRPGLDESDTHRSETELRDAHFDSLLVNSGSLEDWQQHARHYAYEAWNLDMTLFSR